MITDKTRYEDIRQLVERAFQQTPPTAIYGPPASPLPGRRRHKFLIRHATPTARAFDEFHALLVQAAKHHCLKGGARCAGCPLERFLNR
jgi:endonuclease III-like uncharacterized protein